MIRMNSIIDQAVERYDDMMNERREMDYELHYSKVNRIKRAVQKVQLDIKKENIFFRQMKVAAEKLDKIREEERTGKKVRKVRGIRRSKGKESAELAM